METNTRNTRRRRERTRRANLSFALFVGDRSTPIVLFYIYLATVCRSFAGFGGATCETTVGVNDPASGDGLQQEQERRRRIVPESFDSSFGSYPNVLNISPKMRESFAAVVWQVDPVVNDNRHKQSLASSGEILDVKRRPFVWKIFRRMIMRRIILPLRSVLNKNNNDIRPLYDIGKYDENRVSMYSSGHFQDVDNEIDGFGGQRTVHLGIDLGAPVGTPVRAFERGTVHSVGYNSEHGDYGYVIVVEHILGCIIETKNVITESLPEPKRVWALYGHLDRSVLKFSVGSPVRKGEIIGRIGDVDENGGWKEPHVHFQLSVQPPKQPHDMPGASSVKDRPTALLVYPDPRYVLGEIY